MKAAKDREEEYCDPARKDNNWGRKQTGLELWEEHLKGPVTALDTGLKCQKKSLSGLTSCSKFLRKVTRHCNGLQLGGLKHFAKVVGKTVPGRRQAFFGPVGQRAPALGVPRDHCNVAGKRGPHGELLFFLIKKEQVVASNEVLPNPCLCGNDQGVCADWFVPDGSSR